MASARAVIEPFMNGVFALYHTPDGGIHLSYRPQEADEDQHIQIPAIMVAMAQQMSETGKMPNPMQVMKMMRSS